MQPKPNECLGCPLYGDGKGYVPPSGTGSLGVLIVGEAAGEAGRSQGRPFVEWAQSGSLLERVIRNGGWSRAQFRIANVIQCQPPRNYLEGAPYELGAIEHCRVHRDGVFATTKPRAVLALGGIATRVLTGMVGEKRGVSHLRGYPLPASGARDYQDIPVIPSFHPSFIRRGNGELQGVLSHDLARAVAIAAGKDTSYSLQPASLSGYRPFPGLDEARSFLLGLRSSRGRVVAYDIETSRSASVAEDEAEETLDGAITQIQFTVEEGQAIVFPWEGGYIEVAREVLGLSDIAKVGHNSWRFDDPRLRVAGAVVEGTCHDTMQMWRHLQPDLPAGLQFVASFAGALHPWKHLAGMDDGWYGCCDSDNTLRVYNWVRERLERLGMWEAYDRHRRQLEPVLLGMTERGVPVDETERLRLKAAFEQEKELAEAELQGMVPEELKPLKVYKKKPSVRLPFNPDSSKQLLAYIKGRGHKVPTELRTGRETTSAKELERLAKQTGDAVYHNVIRCRNLGKAISTYVEGWAPRSDGRVHGSFYTETGTGQLNSRNPNMQNFPKHGPLAQQMRRMIRAREGFTLAEFDYTAFHALTTGFEAGDREYMRLARLDIHSFVAAHLLRLDGREQLLALGDEELRERLAEIKKAHKEVRDRKAKPAILGIGFGLGERKLFDMNRESFATQREAKEVRELIKSLFPKVFEWQEQVAGLAHRQGWLQSRFGWRRWFWDVFRWTPEGMKPGEDREKALAFLPANDAHCHIKEVMLRLEEQGLLERYGLILPMHDAFIFECPTTLLEECLHTVRLEMQQPSEVLDGLSVGVEASIGPDWASMETAKYSAATP